MCFRLWIRYRCSGAMKWWWRSLMYIRKISVDSVWVKVARDQETIGWIQEHRLLDNIVPVDPISRFIHFFSNAHTLPFFLVLAVFFLWFVYRAVRRKQIKLIWLNDIDSGFPSSCPC